MERIIRNQMTKKIEYFSDSNFSYTMPRIITYNLNGIRAAMGKGLIDWMKAAKPDILCLQEIKATPEQVGVFEFEEHGYHHYWYPAQKKGYSGVAIFSKIKPDNVVYGCGIAEYDFEGRVIRADYGDVSVISVYHPSGSSGDERQVEPLDVEGAKAPLQR